MNKHVFLDATDESAQLKLTYEQEHKCKVVYQKVQKTEDQFIFHSLWNPEVDYPDEYIILPVNSVFGGTVSYPSRQVFANIIGSTWDPHPSGYGSSWLDVLRSQNIDCSVCVTDGYFYSPADKKGTTYFMDYKCDTIMVGGHVVADFYNESPAPGSTVYLIPICHNHNSCSTDSSGNPGSGFYMMARSKGTAVVLKKYMQYTCLEE